MSATVQIIPSRITFRACLDLDWRVTSYCAKCGMGRAMDLAMVCESPLAARPIEALMTAGAIRCRDKRTRCGGEPAHFLVVSWMKVGRELDVARWRAEMINGRRVVRLERARED